MSAIADRIKRVREIEGLKPAQFARKLDEKLQRMQDVERGRQKPPVDILEKIVQRCSINANWLLTGNGDIRGNAINEDAAAYDFDPEARLRDVTRRVLLIAEERKIKPDPMQLGPLRDFAYLADLSDQHIHTVFDLLEDAPRVYGFKGFNNGK